jgi:hypothetical protein
VNDAILKYDGVSLWGQRAARGRLVVQLTPLVEIHDAQPVGSADFPAPGGEFPAQHAQQGRLSATIRPYQPDPHSRRDDEVQPREEGTSTNFAGNILELNQAFSFSIAR